MPLDATHQHSSADIMQADSPHTPIDPNSGGGAVDSVNGQTGDVVLDAGDVGAIPQSGPLTTPLVTAGNSIYGGDGAAGIDGNSASLAGGAGDGGSGGGGATITASGGGGTGQGADLLLLSGAATAGRGGDLIIEAQFGIDGRDGQVIMDTLPATDPAVGDAVWVDQGHLALSGATPLADMFDGRTADFVANGSTVDQLRDALVAAGLMAAS